jgi:hypothetical protein
LYFAINKKAQSTAAMTWTTTVAFYMLGVISAVVMIGPQIDNLLGIPWWGAFWPLWLFCGLLFCMGAFTVGNEQCGEKTDYLTRLDVLILMGGNASFLAFMILLAIRLDTGAPAWWGVFIPLWPIWILIATGIGVRLHAIQKALTEGPNSRAARAMANTANPQSGLLENAMSDGTNVVTGDSKPLTTGELKTRRMYLWGACGGVAIGITFSILLNVYLEVPTFTSLLGLFLPIIIALFILTALMTVFLFQRRSGHAWANSYSWWQITPYLATLVGVDVFLLLTMLKLAYAWGVLWVVIFIPLYVGLVTAYVILLYAVFGPNRVKAADATADSPEGHGERSFDSFI